MKLTKMKLTRLTALLLALILILAAFAGCGSKKKTTEIKIGLVAPMTGTGGSMGVNQRNGYQLAIDEINAAGGVSGAKIVLAEAYDDQGDPQKAASGAQKFADDSSIVAIGGSCNS